MEEGVALPEILNVMNAVQRMCVSIIKIIKNKFRIALLKIQHLTDIIFLLKVLVLRR